MPPFTREAQEWIWHRQNPPRRECSTSKFLLIDNIEQQVYARDTSGLTASTVPQTVAQRVSLLSRPKRKPHILATSGTCCRRDMLPLAYARAAGERQSDVTSPGLAVVPTSSDTPAGRGSRHVLMHELKPMCRQHVPSKHTTTCVLGMSQRASLDEARRDADRNPHPDLIHTLTLTGAGVDAARGGGAPGAGASVRPHLQVGAQRVARGAGVRGPGLRARGTLHQLGLVRGMCFCCHLHVGRLRGSRHGPARSRWLKPRTVREGCVQQRWLVKGLCCRSALTARPGGGC